MVFLKIIFMGTPDFAVPSLKALIEKHNVIGVVTQPDKPRGRGKKLMFSPVKEVALKAGIPVFQPENLKNDESIDEIENLGADIIVVVAYGQILPKRVLDMTRFGCINVHGSLLPKYRGAAPIQRAIIDGETVTGITIMYMAEGLDTGDMIIKREIVIDKDETYGSLHDKMAPIGAEALLEALVLIENGEAKPEKQDDSLSSYAKKIDKSLGEIDWNHNSKEILNIIRGLNPILGAYTLLNGEVFKIWSAEEYSANDGEAGTIIEILNKKGFVVKTKDSAVLIKEVQSKGGKKMSCADYMRGHTIEKGMVLGVN